MPEALSVGACFARASRDGSSSPERSSPRLFLGGVFVFEALDGREASSSARRASFSARLRSASAFFAAAASLPDHGEYYA